MITARRPHTPRRPEVEASAHGFTLCFRNRNGQKRVQLTRKQAVTLAERLNRALERSQPPRPEVDEECWLDPQIM